MFSSLLATAFLFAPIAVRAHGELNRVTAGGVTNSGPNIYYAPDAKNSKTAIRTMFKASGPSFLLPTDFTNANKMACESAGPAPSTIKVAAGQTLSIYWEGATGELDSLSNGVSGYHNWVHAMGPIMDYITSCNGNCNQFDPTNAGWTKIAHAGIDMSSGISQQLRDLMTAKPEKYYPTSGNGKWAMAKLLEQGSKWDVKIPANLKAGQYIVRHELAAIHNPLGSDPTSGPQNYAACIQIDVTGSGSATLPAGTKASDLYSPTGAFAKFDVYSQDPASFKIPGPAVWDGASGGGSSDSGSSGSGSSNSGSSSGSSGNSNPDTTSKAPAKTAPAPASSNTAKASTTTSTAQEEATSAAPQCKRRKRSLDSRVPARHRRAFVRRTL